MSSRPVDIMPPPANTPFFRLIQEGPGSHVSFTLDKENVRLYVAGNDEIYEAAVLTSAIGLGMLCEQDTALSMVACAMYKICHGHLKWKSGAIDCFNDL
jgi:hypothetical protein